MMMSDHLSPEPSTSNRRGRRRTRSIDEHTNAPKGSQKPRKPNSEIRKQQNRIASKNYREKRKRKLQYLQQLLEPQASAADKPKANSERGLEESPRSLSAEHQTPPQTVVQPEFQSPDHMHSIPVANLNAMRSMRAGNVLFGDFASQGAFPNVESSWAAAPYEHQVQDGPMWHNHLGWMPTASQISPGYATDAFEVHPSAQQHYPSSVGSTGTFSSQENRTSDEDFYILGHCNSGGNRHVGRLCGGLPVYPQATSSDTQRFYDQPVHYVFS